MDQLRRQFMQQLLGVAEITLVPSFEGVAAPALLEQLTRMLSKPSGINESTLRYLENQSTRYWQDWHENALSAYDLLSYVTGHLQTVMTFFQGSLLPSTRTRLCSVAGETALLIGTLLFEAGAYTQARRCFQTAIQVAHEGNHSELEATGWGWVSFTYTYSDDLPAALRAAQIARQFISKECTPAAYASLAAIEAEIQAKLQNQHACIQALEQARCIEGTDEKHIWTSFDPLKLAGYRGVCLQHLYQPEDTSTYSFLDQAQNTLIKALEHLQSSDVISTMYSRQQAIFHTDIAGIYIRQGQMKDACQHAIQSAIILRQTKSQTGVQRLLTLRKGLEPWKNTSEVHNVDTYIDSLLVTERH